MWVAVAFRSCQAQAAASERGDRNGGSRGDRTANVEEVEALESFSPTNLNIRASGMVRHGREITLQVSCRTGCLIAP
jgi:hypothetical protein